MKSGKMAKRSSFGSVMRSRLSDITNSLPQSKSPIIVDKLSQAISSSAKEQIAFLAKENMALAKLIGEKNKIIEVNEIELQRLRVNMQKFQLQNWTLAQSNSHMTAELNLGREKLKQVQHELVCQRALLKAKNQQFEGKGKMNARSDDFSPKEGDEEAMEEDKTKVDNKFCNESSRRRPTKSKSMGHSTLRQQPPEKGTDANKRRCLRRQSASNFLKPQQSEPKENFFEIHDIKPSSSPSAVIHKEGCPTTVPSPSITKEYEQDPKLETQDPKLETQDQKRISIGRPLRKATEKVQSYKEMSIKIKLRRAA